MKALVFGITGQDGFYLNELLHKNNIDVIGVSRSNPKWENIDISSFDQVNSLISQHMPKYIFHLAANSTTNHSALFENHLAISTGTLNILESVRLHSPQSRVFLSGSAMQFENSGVPIDESTPFEAGNAYAIARIQSVYVARYYRKKFAIQAYIGYFFNHDSPLRTNRHINQRIITDVKRIAEGQLDKLIIGNPDVQKEFNFAGDIVNGIWKLINQEKLSEIVIGSGKAHSIGDWLSICFSLINKNWQDYVEVDKNFTAEYDILVSNPKKLISLGWQPQVSIEDLAIMMFTANQKPL